VDKSIADLLRRSNKKVLVVVNKVDNSQRLMEAAEFYRMGTDRYFPVSSANGSGTGDSADEIVINLQDLAPEIIPELPRVAIVGRPNVGKSSHCQFPAW
jgi:GTP-binding protein